MSQRPWFPFYPAEFYYDTKGLSLEAQGAYLAYLSYAWNHDGFIPLDVKEHTRILGTHHHKARLLWHLLQGYFDCYPQGYSNKRLFKELAKAVDLSEKRRKAVNKRYSTNVPTIVDTPTPTPTKEERTSTCSSKKPNGIDSAFEEFWTAYPRRQAKARAYKAWNKLSATDQTTAIAALPVWPFTTDKQFIPLPASWINGRRWEDETTSEPIYEDTFG